MDEFTSLAEYCLFILRVEVRCHCYFFIENSLRESNYALDNVAVEPDTQVISLNNDLIGFEQAMSRSLPTNESLFLFDGLAVLVTHLLCSSAKDVRAMTKQGITKMIKNVLALQQNLSNLALSYESRLDHARKFYEIFSTTPDEMYKLIEEYGATYSADEYKAVLDLLYRPYFDAKLNDHPQKKVYDEALARVQKFCF